MYVELISGITVGFSLGVLVTILTQMARKRKRTIEDIPFYNMDNLAEENRPFIQIPTKDMLNQIKGSGKVATQQFQDSMETFKTRNRFYTDDDSLFN
ncbi:MAG: hypothetical protein WBG90_12390 [Saonia sp.]